MLTPAMAPPERPDEDEPPPPELAPGLEEPGSVGQAGVSVPLGAALFSTL